MSNTDFVNTIGPLIQAEAAKRGYKICSTAIAQACCESNYGKSSLSSKYHNYFGMKAGKSWKGGVVNLKTKEEYTVGNLTTIVDGFRTYPNMAEGVKGYYDFISASRYANLKTASTPEEYAQMLKADGYATSSTYVKTLMNFVNVNNLTSFDDDGPYPRTYANPKPVSSLLKKGAKGDEVIELQKRLAAKGYTVGNIDGIFGIKTELAVKQLQADNGLKTDGIVGPKTRAVL